MHTSMRSSKGRLEALLITRVDWSYNHPQGVAAAGTRQILLLLMQNLANDNPARRAYESSILLGSQGERETARH
jgi:hypothetical protein